METDIISLIGMTCIVGTLIIWAKDTFRRDVEDIEEGETEKPIKKTGQYEIKI